MKNDEVPFNTNQNYLNLLSIILWKSWGVVSNNLLDIETPPVTRKELNLSRVKSDTSGVIALDPMSYRI